MSNHGRMHGSKLRRVACGGDTAAALSQEFKSGSESESRSHSTNHTCMEHTTLGCACNECGKHREFKQHFRAQSQSQRLPPKSCATPWRLQNSPLSNLC
eukprot:359993-Chlamydomonas_euryale.AAC.7